MGECEKPFTLVLMCPEQTKSEVRLATVLTSYNLACLMSLWVRMGQIGYVRQENYAFVTVRTDTYCVLALLQSLS